MPLNAFIYLSTNYLKNICSCDESKILTVWLVHEGSFHYRAQFLVLGENGTTRNFLIGYLDGQEVFSVSEIQIVSTTGMTRKEFNKNAQQR